MAKRVKHSPVQTRSGKKVDKSQVNENISETGEKKPELMIAKIMELLETMNTRMEKSIEIDILRAERKQAGMEIFEQSRGEKKTKIPDEGATMTRSNENANVLRALRIPWDGWLKNPFEEMSFKGREDRQNPMIFIERFEKIAEYEKITEEKQLHYFSRTLKGPAHDWFKMINPKTIHSAKSLFKDYYWNRKIQTMFRQFLYNGRYMPNRGSSMSEYALSIPQRAKILNPPMEDKDIINLLRDHFETEIAREIRPSTVKDLNDLIFLLDSIENAKRPKKSRMNFIIIRRIARRNFR